MECYKITGRLVLKKTGFFSAWASMLNMGLINKGWYGMCVACGIWCLAGVSSVSFFSFFLYNALTISRYGTHNRARFQIKCALGRGDSPQHRH